MKKFVLFALLVGTAWTALLQAQQMSHRLTNQDIIDLVAGGVSNDIIIAKIRSVSGQDNLAFDTSVQGLKALKQANVPDEVIRVMINPASQPVSVAAAGTAIPPGVDPNLPPPEVGIYWKDGAKFVPIEGHALSQAKVGGRGGSYLTYGMRSQHWDATLNGSTSTNRVKDRRPLFYFYVPDGSSSSDFVLIKLEKKEDRREFQVGSFGGVTAGKSGVKRDKEIPFTAEHVAIRTFRVTVDRDLAPGEYAFFMGTSQQAMMSSGTISSGSGGSAAGRIFDFSVPD
jgi:hypothetical protein